MWCAGNHANIMKKKTIATIWLAALFLCGMTMQLYGQTHKTHSVKKSFTQQFPACELTDDVEVNFTAYYDEDDNEIYHGPFSAKHLRNLNRNGVVGKLEYISSGNYIEGKLDGPLSITIIETFSRPHAISMKTALVASYKNGVPTGKWTASEQGTLGSKKENYSITTVFENGEVTSLSKSTGAHVTFELISTEKYFDDVVKIYSVSGKLGDDLYEKGLNRSSFIRKNGNHSELDDEAKAILNDLSSGKIKDSELIDKGYIKQYDKDLTEDIFGYWDVLLGIESSWNSYYLGITQYDKLKEGFRYRTGSTQLHKYRVYKLRRVTLTSAENVIASLDDNSTRYMSTLETYRNYANENNLNGFYFNNVEKVKVLEYLDKKISELAHIEELKESLSNGVSTFTQKYQSKSYLADEIQSFAKKCNYYAYSNITDTTKLKYYLTLLSLYDDICQTTIDFYQGANDILSQTKSSYPKINKIYTKMFNSYDDTCPEEESKLQAYLQQVKGWRNDQQLTNAYIALLPTIDANAQKITASSNGNVVTSYKAAEKSADYAYSAEVQRSVENAKAWLKKQTQYIESDSLMNIVIKNDAQIAELSGKNFSDVQKNYSNYRKQNSLEIADNIEIAIEDIRKVIDVQNGCINFLNERVKIFDANARIVEKGKACKNILKVYTSYMKGVDLSWTETVSIQKLLAVESIQAKFENAFTSPEASQLDKDVKKSKDKSVNTVLTIISK